MVKDTGSTTMEQKWTVPQERLQDRIQLETVELYVGRYTTDLDRIRDYASVMVDELIFFNQALSNDDIDALYNAD